MSLHFDSVTLRNFGPYRLVENLDLSTTPDASVVVIHGENTLGKTQLFSALRWCLYGSFQPQQTPDQVLPLLGHRFNRPAQRDGEDVMEVSMKFTANGQPYALTRRATFATGSVRVSADLRIGPTVIQQAAIEAEIGRLLHPQISEFFLFDAELMQRFYDRLATERERAFIRQSIESVLGIPALQLAEQDVSELAHDALQRQAKAAQNASDADRIKRRLRQLRNDQESIERDRTELQQDLRKAEGKLREVREKLKVVDSLQADVREQETLEAQIVSGEQTESKLKAEMRQLLGSGWLAPIAGKLGIALESVQRRNTAALDRQHQVSEARTRVAVLKERTKGGTCPSCKQTLPPPNASTQQELAEAEAELAEIEQHAGGNPDLALERKISSLIDDSTLVRYTEKQDLLNETLALQYQRRRNLAQIKDRLQGNSAAEIRSLGQQQVRLDDVVDSLTKKLAATGPALAKIATEQQKLARQLDKLPGAQPNIVLESNFFGYVQTLLSRTIERYQERTREEVQTKASDMFVRLIRDSQGYGGLRISPDYRVELLDTRERPRETSEGGKQLVALSLIGALKQAAVRGGPVVLDSPLARLDLEHRSNVLQTWVPSLGSQVVLLVQSGELTQADAHRILDSQIRHEYRISRPTNDPELAIIERTQ